jgi:hypothetical protein
MKRLKQDWNENLLAPDSGSGTKHQYDKILLLDKDETKKIFLYRYWYSQKF